MACSRGRGDGVLEASIALASPPGSSGVPAGETLCATPSPRRGEDKRENSE